MIQSESTPQGTTFPLTYKPEDLSDPQYLPMLVCLKGPQAGARYCLHPGQNLVGRAEKADIVLIDGLVSRNHCIIEFQEALAPADPECIVMDSGSRNGTEVNGQVIERPLRLYERDRIRVGETMFGFVLREETELESDRMLYEMATRDSLTGLSNRYQFREHLNHYCKRYSRSKKPMSLIFTDIDSFKEVNDLYGHDGGDHVLIQVANLLEKSCREGEICSRWGGEEFAILLPDVDVTDASVLAERLRSSVESSPVSHLDARIPVTISLGVTQMKANEGPEELFRRADQNMLRAKSNGKNRVVAD